jgi:glycosyltransferase involved in cell wall biosynthesis
MPRSAASRMESSALKRIDLHCHSEASNRASEVLLKAISCPECYSTPLQVFEQARQRGMDFVTITDHDTIAGALELADRPEVIVGEELTCWFPEDDCKLHLLLWGITPQDHDHLQSVARDIYAVAQYVHGRQIAHAVAHPLYRQNDKIERWHVERLLLLFKGFECLNGAHSALHRDAFEPLLNQLSRAAITRLSERHNLQPLWPEPWIKARVAGSDDHGLLNVGRTWTEFPADASSREDILQCLRDATCQPGGESGSSIKLAHTFYSVAVRYYTRELLEPAMAGRGTANLPTMLLQMLVGQTAMPSKRQLIRHRLAGMARKLGGRVVRPFRDQKPSGTAMLRQIFLDSVRKRVADHPSLLQTLRKGLPPLGEHDEIFRFVQAVNRDISGGIAAAIGKSIDDASFTGLFDAIASLIAQQFVLLPYYFAVFHQNREKRHLRKITGQLIRSDPGNIKVGLFTDTLDEVNGVGRFLREMSAQAARHGRSLTIHTCAESPHVELPNRRNFRPLLSHAMPYYPELKLNLPPVLEILEWADRQQFDAIHVSTPGPMGICSWLAAKMLRVPLLGTYHTDFPAYIEHFTKDHRAGQAATAYLSWLSGQMAGVFTRSHGYVHSLRGMGVPRQKVHTILPSVDNDKFHPRHRNDGIWQKYNIGEKRKLLYCGRISVEKNLAMLTTVFRRLCAHRQDTALVVAGDGPYLPEMRQQLAGLPVHFLGCLDDASLAALYATSDLLVFPSRTDTLGQVVMEAHASGLPAIVSNEGGPKEIVKDNLTGLVLSENDAAAWTTAIDRLLHDEPRRRAMASAAPQQVAMFSPVAAFEAFWAVHVDSVESPRKARGLAATAVSI